jgi:transposase-like protein
MARGKRSERELVAVVQRRRWTADEAGVVLRAAEASGQSVMAFAEAHGLDPFRLYRWSRKLRRGCMDTDGEVTFEEVTPLVADSGRGLEVVLRTGHVVRVQPGFDGDTLRRTVEVLEDRDDTC